MPNAYHDRAKLNAMLYKELTRYNYVQVWLTISTASRLGLNCAWKTRITTVLLLQGNRRRGPNWLKFRPITVYGFEIKKSIEIVPLMYVKIRLIALINLFAVFQTCAIVIQDLRRNKPEIHVPAGPYS